MKLKTNYKVDELVYDMVGDERYYYQTDKNWVFELEDGKRRQFGIVYEILDMDEATGEPEFKDYPFVISASIVAHRCHKSFNEDPSINPTLDSLRYDALSYMGGAPIDHILQNAVKSGSEPKDLDAFEIIAKQFSASQAKVVSYKADYGTVAAQNGFGFIHKYLQFKTHADAKRYVDYLASNRVGAMGIMIGFTLDRPINLVGETGWNVIQKHVKGLKGAK